jgi:hypothetical protein
MPEPVKYSDLMAVKVEPQLRLALQALAARHRVKVSELIRNSLWTAVALHGNDENPDVRPNGERRYARLEGGAVTDVIYAKPTP